MLVNPNNPTGSFLKQPELGPLLALCREHNLALISDEVFADYALDDDARLVRSLTGIDEVLTFCLSGLSKVAALAAIEARLDRDGRPACRSRESFRAPGTDRRHLPFRQRSGAMGSTRAARPARPTAAANPGARVGPTGLFSRVKSAQHRPGNCWPPKAAGTRSWKRRASRAKRNGF